MSFPEEAVTYCQHCALEIPVDCYWRGRGFIIGAAGRQVRTPILYTLCPVCARQYSTGLNGNWWYRTFYGWMWKLRYPGVHRPDLDFPAVEEPRRRASGE